MTASQTTNHSYVRIPLHQRPEFFAFWADGDTTERSPSQLYFCTDAGRVYRMPRQISGDWARPQPVR